MPTDAPRTKDRLLTAADVARRYDVNIQVVRRWLRKGIIAHVVIVGPNIKRIPASEAAKHFRSVAGARI